MDIPAYFEILQKVTKGKFSDQKITNCHKDSEKIHMNSLTFLKMSTKIFLKK